MNTLVNWDRVDKTRLLVVIWFHALLAYFLYSFEWWYLIPFILLNLLMNANMSIFLHKGLSHRNYSYNSKILDHIFSIVTMILFLGGPIQWALMHRLHRKYLDKEEDPHAPSVVGSLVSHFHLWKKPDVDIKKKIKIRDIFRDYKHLMIYFKYPITISILCWLVIGLLFGLEGLAIVGAAACWHNHTLGIVDCWVHRKGHGIVVSPNRIQTYLSYVTFCCPDGFEHDEHHKNPRIYSYTKGWLDYHARIMELLAKRGLVKINAS